MPTPIQQKAIPCILDRKDVMGIAQTGTGKTAAFVMPIIQLIHTIDHKKDKRRKLRALILTPTRELAIQINDAIKDYSKYTRVRHTVIFGGVKQSKQVNALKRGVEVLVATPGRLLDLIGQGLITLDDLKVFVLDEADRMLDMGFIHDIKKVERLLPRKRQTLFFSATMPENIVALSKFLLHNPTRIEVALTATPAESVNQFLYFTDRQSKLDLLLHILDNEDVEQALIFVRTKYGADKLVKKLNSSNLSSVAIHGNKSQNHRQKALASFKAGAKNILVATDIAARGIDIKELKHVINYNVPNIPETYVHRIGRSGRAGEKGTSITIVEADENKLIKPIERVMNRSIAIVTDNPFPQSIQHRDAQKDAPRGNGRRKNRRSFKKKHYRA